MLVRAPASLLRGSEGGRLGRVCCSPRRAEPQPPLPLSLQESLQRHGSLAAGFHLAVQRGTHTAGIKLSQGSSPDCTPRETAQRNFLGVTQAAPVPEDVCLQLPATQSREIRKHSPCPFWSDICLCLRRQTRHTQDLCLGPGTRCACKHPCGERVTAPLVTG